MNKLLLASYLGVLLSSCATDRVAAQPPDCNSIYQKFTKEQAAFENCRKDYKCSWTYDNVLERTETQQTLFNCFKERQVSVDTE
jgi:hypothetical protein